MQIKDFINATTLALADLLPISQSGNTRKITLQAIKEFLLGTTTLTTTDQTITGAIEEVNTSLSDIEQQILLRPLMTTADITYYVSVTGSDSNDGLTGGTAFKTIQYAIDLLPQVINHTVIINVASGTYGGGLTIPGFDGKGTLSINGGTTLANSINYIISNSIKIDSCTINITLNGFKLLATTTLDTILTISNCTMFNIKYCSFDGALRNSLVGNIGVGVSFSKGSILNSSFNNFSSSSYGYVIYSSVGAEVLTRNNVGSNNSTVFYALAGGVITKYDAVQPSGTIAETVANGGVIR